MTCKHPTLRFHSGGYYVECKECKLWWVAIKQACTSDQDLDHTRGADGLYAHDERVIAVAQASGDRDNRPYCDPVEQGKAFYLAMHESKGAIWNANEHQDLWIGFARDYERRRREALALPSTHQSSPMPWVDAEEGDMS